MEEDAGKPSEPSEQAIGEGAHSGPSPDSPGVAALGNGTGDGDGEGQDRRAVRRSPRPVRRTVDQKVRLTIEEQAELRRRAEALGLSVPRYLHEKALSDSETDWERRQLIALRFEITRLVATIANNVNQLAKVANTSGQVAHAARLEQTLGDVAGLLEDLRGTGLRGTGL